MRLSLSREKARVRLLQSAVARSKSTAPRWLSVQDPVHWLRDLSRGVRAPEVAHYSLAGSLCRFPREIPD
jgi:hypothetical protein